MFNGAADQVSKENFAGTILPDQYFGNLRRRKLREGEYRLLLAVLEQAIRSYLINLKRATSEQRADFEELRRWFYLPRNATQRGLFAFESICELIGIDADLLRERLGSLSLHALPTHRYRPHPALVPGLRRARRRRTNRSRPAA
jgi:hypothetical protein